MQYRDYFWDFDGNLFDTYPAMTASYVKAWQSFGVSIEETQAYRQMRQGSLKATMQADLASHPEIDLAELRAKYEAIEATYQADFKPFEYVKEVCHAVVATGGHNFLLTHRNQGALEALEKHNLSSLFSGGVTGKQHFARKPAPDSLNYLCQKYGVDKNQAVMVGDRDLDVMAGHNAGMAGILFDPDDLIVSQSKPELRIRSFKTLLD